MKFKMKKSIFLVAAFLISVVTVSQENKPEMRTILGQNNKVSHGGYGALTFGYTSIDNKDAFMIGAKGGWVIGHTITIGLAGTSFVNDIYYPSIYEEGRMNLVGGYGGLLIEPIIAPFSPVHLSFPVIIGAGGIAHVNYSWWNYDDYYDPKVWDSDAFFVIEPGVEVEANIVPFMRLALGVSYRHTSMIRMKDTKGDVMRGLSAGISLKFGKF
jgi:hypothetical protein